MKKLNKRILSALLALLMFLSSCPVSAFSADLDETVPEVTQTAEVTEPEVTDPVATDPAASDPAGCQTCGMADCAGSHIDWCAICKVDSCGKNHCPTCQQENCEKDHSMWCALCQKDECGLTHVFCETCQKYDCGETHVFCETCGVNDCGRKHVFCEVCNKYDCGEKHIFCEECQMFDCIVDGHGETAPAEPAATEPAATEPDATEPAGTEPAATEPDATEPAGTEPAATEPAATADNCPYCDDTTGENGETVHAANCNAAYVYKGAGDVGKFAELAPDAVAYGVSVSENPKTDDEGILFYADEFEADTILRITCWYWDPVSSALWYRVTFYSGGVVSDAAEDWPSTAWILQKYTNPDNDYGITLSTFYGCSVCGLPACETEHVQCDACGEYDCETEHVQCDACGEYDCETEHVQCDTCGEYDCETDHVQCDTCGEYDCETEHVFCETCSEYDCGLTHETAPQNDEFTSPFHANIGRKARFDLSYTHFPIVASPAEITADTVFGMDIAVSRDVIPEDMIVEIVGCYVNETEDIYWYEIKATDGCSLPAEFTDPAWVYQDNVSASTGASLILLEEPAQVPSVSGNGITVSSESGIPAGSAVSMANHSSVGDGSENVYDIKVLNADGTKWQPAPGETVRVSMPVSIENSGTVSVVHILEDAEQITYALANGKAKVQDLADVDASFQSLLGDAVAAYRSAAGSSANAVAYELFEDVPVVNGYVTVNACGFSIYVIGESGYAGIDPDWNDLSPLMTYYVKPGDTITFSTTQADQSKWVYSDSNGIVTATDRTVEREWWQGGNQYYKDFSVAGTAVNSQTFTITFYGKTITFQVIPADAPEEDPNKETVAISIYLDSGFPAEPLKDSSGHYWRYTAAGIMQDQSSDYSSTTNGIIKVDKLLSSSLMVENDPGLLETKVYAIVDNSGQRTLEFIMLSEELKADLVAKYLAEAEIDEDPDHYEFLIYVVKKEVQYSSSKWYINGKVVKKNNVLVTYERNVPNGFDEFSVEKFPNNKSVEIGSDVTLETPGTTQITAKIGNTNATAEWIGWSTDPNAIEPEYTGTDTISDLEENLELYAVWKITGVEYTESDIEISKWVVFDNSGEPDYSDVEDFSFTLTGDGLNGKTYTIHDYSGMQIGESETISGSTLQFTLKNGYTIVIPDVPQGTYTVSETLMEGYKLGEGVANERTFTFGKDAINVGEYLTTYENRKIQYFTISFFDGTQMTALVNPNPIRSESGKEVELKNISKSGYDFIGWKCEDDTCTDCNGADPKYHTGKIIMPAKNIEMYSQWVPHTYEVAFDGNGATGGTMEKQPFTYGVEQELNDNKFEKKYTITYNADGGTGAPASAVAQAIFAGWMNGDTTYTNKQSVKNLTPEDKAVYTMTAQWTPGSVSLPAITKKGHTFGGWYKDEDFTVSAGETDSTYTPAGNETLYAKFTPNTYTVKVQVDDELVEYTGLDGFEWVTGENSIRYLQKQVPYGTEIVAQFTAKTGCRLDQIQIGQTEGDPDGDGKVTHKVEADVVIQVKADRLQYTIAWLNEDGTWLLTSTATYGVTPYYNGETPTKPATAQYTYTFAGWTPEVVPATKNATYTATYKEVLREYEIIFVDEDGTTVLYQNKFPYGSEPEYKGEIPTKAATAQYSYTFAGWDTKVTTVTGAATYTATYTQTVNQYEVTFKDEDGTILMETKLYDYGTAATDIERPADPTKAATAQYSYTFAGWTPEITNVTENVVYTATYTETVNEYTITFKNEDGTELQSSLVPYGETPVYSGETPTKATDGQYAYEFAGWDIGIVPVTGDAVYTASYNAFFDFYASIDSGTIVHAEGESTLPLVWNHSKAGSRVGETLTFKPAVGSRITTVEINDEPVEGQFDSNGNYVYTFEAGMSAEVRKIEVFTETIKVQISIELGGGDNTHTVYVSQYSDVLIAITPATGTSLTSVTLKYADGTEKVVNTFDPNGYIFAACRIEQSVTIVVGATSENVYFAAGAIDSGDVSLTYHNGSGQVTVNSDGTVSCYVPYGSNYKFSLNASEGRYISSLSNGTVTGQPQTYELGGVMNANNVVHAYTSAIEYTITYEPNNGGESTTVGTGFKDTVTLADAPVKEGYTFTGWWYNKNADTVVDEDELYEEGASFTMPAYDVTMIAQWIDSRLTGKRVYVGINMSFFDENGNWYYNLPDNEPKVIHNLRSVRVYKDGGSWNVQTVNWYDTETGINNKFTKYLPGTPDLYITEDVFNPAYGYKNNLKPGQEGAEGIFDASGVNTKHCLNFSDADYSGIIQTWLIHAVSYLKGEFPDINVNWDKISKNAADYTIIPYVIKHQNNGNWYVDMVIEPINRYAVTYKLGLKASYEGTAPVDTHTYGKGFNATLKDASDAVSTADSELKAKFTGWCYDANDNGQIDGDEGSKVYEPGELYTIVDKNIVMIAQWEYPETLTIHKNSSSNRTGDTFLFKVHGTNVLGEEVSMLVSIHGTGSVRLNGIYCGTYTVTEMTNWSWTYTAAAAQDSVTVTTEDDVTDNMVSFSNTFQLACWLFDENHNLFHE